MKKVFALVLALGAMTAVFAQRGYDRREGARDVILGQRNGNIYDGHRNDGYYSIRERDADIQRIRRDYNWKIESVQHNRYLRKAEKRRQIRFLENERDARIRQVIERYNYSNRNYRSNRRF